MIRINLLGSPKPKGKKGPAFNMPTFEVGNLGGPLVQVAAVLVIAGALNFGYWYQLDRERKSIEVRALVAEQKNRELAAVKVKYLERQRRADSYKHRVDVIDQLRANKWGRVSLLAMMGDRANATGAVGLKSLQDRGASVAIEATAGALSLHAFQPDRLGAVDRIANHR